MEHVDFEGRDFFPVLIMIGAWGSQYRGGGKLVQILDAETGLRIKPVVVDEITGEKIGTRPLRVVIPDCGELRDTVFSEIGVISPNPINFGNS